MKKISGIFRYLISLSLGVMITLVLFVVMQRMLQFDQVGKRAITLQSRIDFIRLIREPEPIIKTTTRTLPKKPKLPQKKVLLPKIKKMRITTPKPSNMHFSAPKIVNQLNLNDAMYLGTWHKTESVSEQVVADEEVVPLVRIAPVYPSRAVRLGIEGWVKMEVRINAKGGVISAKVLDAMPSRIFNRAAIKAVKRWRFRPKIVNGKAVSRTAEQTIHFKLRQ